MLTWALLAVATSLQAARGAVTGSDATFQLKAQAGHTGPPLSVAVNGEQTVVASGGLEGTVLLWSVRTGRVLRALASGSEQVFGFSPDGKVLATGGDRGSVLLWDPQNGELLRRLSVGPSRVVAAALSADGSEVAILGGTLTRWEVATGRKLFERQVAGGR